METSLLDQGITLMLVGMGTVFVFLTVLVAGMSTMSTIVRRLSPAVDATEPVDGDADENVIAAITTAIHLHRNKTTK